MRTLWQRTGTVSGFAVESGRTGRPGAAPPCDRGGDLGHAGGQLRPDAAPNAQARRRTQRSRLLVAADHLEEPDPDAQPRHHLLVAVLQHQGRRACGAGDPARRHGHDRRLGGRLLADRDRRRRARRRRQGRRRQVPRPAARPSRRCPRRLHRIAVADISVLCAAALELSQRSRRRHRRRGGVRETRSGLSALGGGRPATDHIHRRDRRLVRRDHPLRRTVFRVAEPHRPDRAVADPRQGDGRLTEDDRHREGQAVHPGRQDDAGFWRQPCTKRTHG